MFIYYTIACFIHHQVPVRRIATCMAVGSYDIVHRLAKTSLALEGKPHKSRADTATFGTCTWPYLVGG